MSNSNNKRYTKHIYFTKETFERADRFIKKEWGSHHAWSLVTQKAMNEYLDRHEANEGVTSIAKRRAK